MLKKKDSTSVRLVEPQSIIARGFPWKITKSDIRQMFSDVNILNGENGVQIIKNIAMEAYFKVGTENDLINALSYNGKKFESRTIYGK